MNLTSSSYESGSCDNTPNLGEVNFAYLEQDTPNNCQSNEAPLRIENTNSKLEAIKEIDEEQQHALYL